MSYLDSGRKDLFSLFTSRAFCVPPYQRSYAWDQRQWSEFLDDLANVPEGRNYFLGTLLFMSPTGGSSTGDNDGNRVFHVVDGQQRLTTAVLFLNALHHTRPGLVKPRDIRTFLIDDDVGAYKFQTVQEDWPCLRALIDGTPLPPAETPSQKRLQDADVYFRKAFTQREDAILQRWLQTLSNSTVLVHAVDGYGEASMIFETVNDRGKRLTDLESLKSFLMHIVGLTRRSAQAEQQAIDSLQSNFGAIYRMINRFEYRLDEDAALRQCYFLFSRQPHASHSPYWNGAGNAKDDAKAWLLRLVRDSQNEVAFNAALALAQHIHTSFKRIESLVNNSFRWEEIERLWVLRRIANFWPILLTTYPTTPAAHAEYRAILRLCEIASLKIWGIGDFRVDKAQSDLIRIAQECPENPREVIRHLQSLLKWWDVPRRWDDGLHSRFFYHQGRDARYVLFEYENHLRMQQGFPRIPYADFDEMTIEHIAAQKGAEVEKALLDLSAPNCPHSVEPAATTVIEGTAATATSLLHHIGNLVVDPQPSNSRKNNLPVSSKLPWFQTAPYLSQVELEADLQRNNLVWGAQVIQARGTRLIAFARQRWDEDAVFGSAAALAPAAAVGEGEA
jgi:hypothetical protein